MNSFSGRVLFFNPVFNPKNVETEWVYFLFNEFNDIIITA